MAHLSPPKEGNPVPDAVSPSTEAVGVSGGGRELLVGILVFKLLY